MLKPLLAALLLCIGIPLLTVAQCNIGDLPSVTFSSKGNESTISKNNKAILTAVASKIKDYPGCKVVITGYCSNSKRQQQLSWKRVAAVINYLVEKEGISSDRLIFRYGEDGPDCSLVDIRAAQSQEDGPGYVPPPHPNLDRPTLQDVKKAKKNRK